LGIVTRNLNGGKEFWIVTRSLDGDKRAEMALHGNLTKASGGVSNPEATLAG
jgi:hypothetical protein